MTEVMVEQVDNIINKLSGIETTSLTEQHDSNNSDQKFYCDAKNQEQLNDFVDSVRPKLVALVGFPGYGKSTFIGSLYQLLTTNLSYGGYNLVDSDTYVGFERRVFLRRVNNDNTSDTKRNVLGENDILHLKLRSEGDGSYHDILVSDKAGETYSKYISSDRDTETDNVLINADIVVFFVDAEIDSGRLATHNLLVENYESLLTRLKIQQKLLDGLSYIVVYSKIDKVNTDELKKKLSERKKQTCGVFKNIIGRDPESVCDVNSTDLNDNHLEALFCKLIQPKGSYQEQHDLDWVKSEIEKEK